MKYEQKKLERTAELLKAFGHPIRLCIINCLKDRNCNVSEIQQHLALPQSTVSQHLSMLKAKRIIQGKRHGPEIRYSLIDDSAQKLIDFLSESEYE